MDAIDERIVQFTSGSSTFSSYNPATKTLSLSLNHERDQLTVHSFAFTVRFAETVDLVNVRIENAGQTQYAAAWSHHVPYVRRDDDWQPTDLPVGYEGGCLQFAVRVNDNTLTAAWYPPYSLADLDAFVNAVLADLPYATVERADSGHVTVCLGNVRAPVIFVVARQHPGESIGSFVLEGFLRRLLADSDDSRRVLERFRFVVIPAINVEGIRKELHRHDPQGRDLNRSWTSRPEPQDIAVVKAALGKVTDLFAFIDIHGDEVSKINFINYRIGRGVESRRAQTYAQLLAVLENEDPKGYVWKSLPFAKRFAKALIRQHKLIRPIAVTANAYVARKYKTLALTVEPSVHALTPATAAAYGASFVPALHRICKSESDL